MNKIANLFQNLSFSAVLSIKGFKKYVIKNLTISCILLSCWFTNAQAMFLTESTLPNTLSGTVKDIDFGDIDNDGDLDIVAFPSSVGRFTERIFINNIIDSEGNIGEFGYTDETDSRLPDSLDCDEISGSGDSANDDVINGCFFLRSYDGDIGDLNNDGFADIFRADRNGLFLMINDGTGNFTEWAASWSGISTGNGPNQVQGNASLLPNNRDIIQSITGCEVNDSAPDCPPNPLGNTEDIDSIDPGIDFDGVAFGDLDGDGDSDVVIANYINNGANLYLVNKISDGEGFEIGNLTQTNSENCNSQNNFGDAFEFSNVCTSSGALAENRTHGVIIKDVNGSGGPDIIFTNISGSAAVDGMRLLINQGIDADDPDGQRVLFSDQTTLLPSLGSASQFVDAVIEDIDNDGDQDIYVVDRNNPNHLFYWDSTGGQFVDHPTLDGTSLYADCAGCAGENQTYDVSVADIDADGDLDIIEGPGESGNLSQARVLLNQGGTDADLVLEPIVGYDISGSGHNLTQDLGDVDFDLDIDVIAGGWSGPVLYQNSLFNDPDEEIDIMMALDNTGSMRTSTHDYLAPVKNIARAILAQARDSSRIGFLTYNWEGPTSITDPAVAGQSENDADKTESVFPLGDFTDEDREQLEQDIIDVNVGGCSLTPGFCTSIGAALDASLNELESDDIGHKRVMVLLTDGGQNLEPSPQAIIDKWSEDGGLPEGIAYYSVSLGRDTDIALMKNISSLGSEYFESRTVFDMADVFRNIESDATEKQLLKVTGPGQAVEIPASQLSDLFELDFSALPLGPIHEEARRPLGTNGLVFHNDRKLTVPTLIDNGIILFSQPPNSNALAASDTTGAFLIQNLTGLDDDENPIADDPTVPLTIEFNRLQRTVAVSAKTMRQEFGLATLFAFDQKNRLLGTAVSDVGTSFDAVIALQSDAANIAKIKLLYSNGASTEVIDALAYSPEASKLTRDHHFRIRVEDRQVRVSATWQNNVDVDVLLLDPDGFPVDPTQRAIRTIDGNVYSITDMRGPKPGQWTVRATSPADERVFISSMASSDLRLTVESVTGRYDINDPISFNAFVSTQNSAGIVGIEGVEFVVRVTKPGGAVINSAIDSANIDIKEIGDGNYTIVFNSSDIGGTYRFDFEATVAAGTPEEQTLVRRADEIVLLRPGSEVCDANSTISASSTSTVANGTDMVRLRAELIDCDGNPLSTDTGAVDFITSGGTLLGGIIDTGNGTFEQDLQAPTTTGSTTVYPIVGGRKLDISVVINFVSGPASAAESDAFLLNSEGFVRAPGSGVIRIIPRDAQGNLLGDGIDVSLSVANVGIGDLLVQINGPGQ